jgi:glutaredoxin
MAQEVKLYTMQACRHCETVKEYLNMRGIAYKIIEVPRDKSGFNALKRLKGAGLPPVITLNGRVYF